MSLKVGREDFSLSRLKRALPVFLLLWFGAVFLALTVLVTVRVHLQHIEIREAEEALDLFLAGHQLPQNGTGFRSQFFNKLSRDLVFVRVVRGGEQLFLLDNSEGIEGFKELADISPEVTGPWMYLSPKKQTYPMTVISRKLDSGMIIQAGKDGRESYQLFHELMWDTIYAMIGSIVVLWLVAMFFVKQSLAPLVDTRKQVRELGRGTTSATLPEDGNGPELDGLYQEINALLRRNRQLVHEIQDSLDNVAHDLRTPMTRLRSVAEYGLQEEDPEKLREALSDCLEDRKSTRLNSSHNSESRMPSSA
jgi:methyl-accepting chemotaxis protein